MWVYANPVPMLSQRCSVSESGACHQPTYEELLSGNSGVHRAPTQALRTISATTCMARMGQCYILPTPQDLSLHHFMSKRTGCQAEPWAPRKAVNAGAGAVNQKSTRWLVSSLLGAWWAVKWRGEEMIWFLRANRAELDLKLRLELGTEFNYQGEPQSRGMTSEDPVEGKHKETLPIH